MTYVRVKEETEDVLHLCREPSSRAWAILFALVALGAGAAMYSVDYLLWKLAYFSGAVLVGLSCLEDWEESYFDKKTGKITFKKHGLIQKIFKTGQNKAVVADVNEVLSVDVREEDMKYGNVGYVVVLNFESGYSIGVTEVATTDDRSEHDLVAKKIRQFLRLNDTAVASPSSEAEDLDYNSTTSEEGFEHIDKSELMDEDDEDEPEETGKKPTDPPGED